MNCESVATNRTALLGSGLLLLLVAAPQPRDATGAFLSHPRRSRTAPRFSRSKRTGSTGSTGRASLPFRRTAEGDTTRLRARLARLDSLRAVAADPRLFPTTSDYIRALDSQAEGTGAATTSTPSPEEFLTQLSTELLRATATSRSHQLNSDGIIFQTASPKGSPSSSAAADAVTPTTTNSLPFTNLSGSTRPAVAVATAMGVAAAAGSYYPASYASQMASSNNDGGTFNGMEGRVADYATAAYADANAAYAAASITATPDDGGNAASQSFAAWRSQGGSNALRDLASSIPNAEQRDVAYAAPDAANGANDYLGRGGYYSAQDAAEAGQRVAPVMQDVASGGGFDSSAAENAYAPPNLEIGDAAAGAYGGANGAPAPATDYLAVDASLPIRATADPTSFPGVDEQQLSDSLSSRLSDLSYDGLPNMDGRTATADLPSSPLLSDYVKANVDRFDIHLPKVSNPLSELDLPSSPLMQEAASSVKEAGGASKERLDSILNTLSHSLDGMQMQEAASSVKEAGGASKERLDSILRTLSHSLDGMQGALSSVKEAGGASAKRLDGVLNAVSQSVDGLGDRVSHASNSLEGLSGQVGKAADAGASGARALGNAVRGGASRVAELTSRAPKTGVGEGTASSPSPPDLPDLKFAVPKMNIEGMASSPRPSAPNLDFEVPTPPNFKFELPPMPPSLPALNVQRPSLPHINVVEGTNAAIKHMNDASLSDVGNAVIASIQFIGGILVKFLNLVLDAASPGTSVASLLADVRSSVASAVDDAGRAALSAVADAGDLSVKDILQHLLALTVAVADVLLKVANAVLYLLSGRDGADWALRATGAVDEAGSRLLASAASAYDGAASAYDGATHESLGQFARSIGDYSHRVGDELLALIGSLNGGADGMSLDGVPLLDNADAIDGVATAVQTALNL